MEQDWQRSMFASTMSSSVRSLVSHFSDFCFHHRADSVRGGNWWKVSPASQILHRQMSAPDSHGVTQRSCQFVQKVSHSSMAYTRLCERRYDPFTCSKPLQYRHNVNTSVANKYSIINTIYKSITKYLCETSDMYENTEVVLRTSSSIGGQSTV